MLLEVSGAETPFKWCAGVEMVRTHRETERREQETYGKRETQENTKEITGSTAIDET